MIFSLSILGGFLTGFTLWRVYEWWQTRRADRRLREAMQKAYRAPSPITRPFLRLADYD